MLFGRILFLCGCSLGTDNTQRWCVQDKLLTIYGFHNYSTYTLDKYHWFEIINTQLNLYIFFTKTIRLFFNYYFPQHVLEHICFFDS